MNAEIKHKTNQEKFLSKEFVNYYIDRQSELTSIISLFI